MPMIKTTLPNSLRRSFVFAVISVCVLVPFMLTLLLSESEFQYWTVWPHPNCDAILEGNQKEAAYALYILNHFQRVPLSNEHYIQTTSNCSNFLHQRRYRENPSSQEEADYPIAFILTIHHNVEQFERTLRAVYAPQNVYCVHVDAKSDDQFKDAVRGIVNCFKNVFLVSKSETIVYAGFSRLKADINCMQDLLERPEPWKYVVNMCGQEMPKRTNLGFVKALKSFGNKNDIGAGVLDYNHVKRYKYIYEAKASWFGFGPVSMQATFKHKPPPPGNATIYFGSAYNLFTRAFVHYVIHDHYAQELLEYFRDTYSPDEMYWHTLQYHPGTPGGKPEASWHSVARLVNWRDQGGILYPYCQGFYQRHVCVFSVKDLPWIIKSHGLIANKFDLTYDHFAVECLEHWLQKQVSKEAKEKMSPRK